MPFLAVTFGLNALVLMLMVLVIAIVIVIVIVSSDRNPQSCLLSHVSLLHGTALGLGQHGAHVAAVPVQVPTLRTRGAPRHAHGAPP